MLFNNPNSLEAPVQIQLVPLNSRLTISEIASADLGRLINSQEPLQIFDLRHSADWQNEHIPGAQSTPVIKGELTAVRNCCLRDSKVILYSYAGAGPSTIAIARDLESIGCSVSILKGGWEAWSGSGQPVEGEEVSSFSPGPLIIFSEPWQRLVG
jgi:rhodanese-related sulfurtransferase